MDDLASTCWSGPLRRDALAAVDGERAARRRERNLGRRYRIPRIHELIASLNEDSADPVIVRAAMGHPNLVMIHPFSDGNGRMARCLQTLVLAREGIIDPWFSSIEEYLGGNTQAYYDVLAQVGQGRWTPKTMRVRGFSSA